MLTLQVGPKRGDAVGASYRMAYELQPGAIDAAYLNVTLQAAKGPLSTSDFRIVLEGVPIEGGRSFVHLGYAYSYGLMAKLAMKAYLATAGRSKVGFTVIDQGPRGLPFRARYGLIEISRARSAPPTNPASTDRWRPSPARTPKRACLTRAVRPRAAA